MLLLANKPQKEISCLWDTWQDGGKKREKGEENRRKKEHFRFTFVFFFKVPQISNEKENRREDMKEKKL